MMYCINKLNGRLRLIVVLVLMFVDYVMMVVIRFVIIGLGGWILFVGVNLVKVNFVRLLVIKLVWILLRIALVRV